MGSRGISAVPVLVCLIENLELDIILLIMELQYRISQARKDTNNREGCLPSRREVRQNPQRCIRFVESGFESVWKKNPVSNKIIAGKPRLNHLGNSRLHSILCIPCRTHRAPRSSPSSCREPAQICSDRPTYSQFKRHLPVWTRRRRRGGGMMLLSSRGPRTQHPHVTVRRVRPILTPLDQRCQRPAQGTRHLSVPGNARLTSTSTTADLGRWTLGRWMMPRYFRQSRGPKQGRGNPSQSAAVIWYAPAAPFDVMWLECGDEGNELMTDDQGWDT